MKEPISFNLVQSPPLPSHAPAAGLSRGPVPAAAAPRDSAAPPPSEGRARRQLQACAGLRRLSVAHNLLDRLPEVRQRWSNLTSQTVD